jgi:hypothetical protein
MNILFLSVTDQHNHSIGKYVDLHRTYDFNNWVDGFASLSHRFFIFDYYELFVKKGPTATEECIQTIVEHENVDLVILPNLYYEIGVRFLDILRRRGAKSVVVFLMMDRDLRVPAGFMLVYATMWLHMKASMR